jgi:sugar-specific transcriptional regulator TrmB
LRREGEKLGEESLKKVLSDLSVTETEAEIYLFLAKHGLMKGTEVSRQLKKDKAQVYHILKTLQTKGLVEATLQAPARYSPVPIEQIIDMAIKAKREEAKRIENTKQELLEYWKKIDKTKTQLPTEKFVVIEGRKKVYNKVAQMIHECTKQISAITSSKYLLRAEQFGLYEITDQHELKSKIQVRFLTELTVSNCAQLKTVLSKMSDKGFNFRGRNPEQGQSLYPKMFVKDEDEALILLTPKGDSSAEDDNMGLWTNCGDLVQAFNSVFEDLWINSTDLKKSIGEIESGKPSSRIIAINNGEAVRKKFYEILNLAEKEVDILTSQNGIIDFSKNRDLLLDWKRRNIKTRILAPITNENKSSAHQLMKRVEVRHIPADYIQTIIVDNNHLLEFKNASSSKISNNSDFENAIYTNDEEYIKKTKNMINYLWQTSQPPFPLTLETMAEAKPEMDPFFETTLPKTIKKMYRSKLISYEKEELKEKDIVNKMLNIQGIQSSNKPKCAVRTYGTNCQAIIHPPFQFNLPHILFHIYHIEKHSTFGAEDVIVVHPWMETPMGPAYVLSALITDNPKSIEFWKKACKNSPAENNVSLAKPDEIEVRVHGNSQFAAWAFPIKINSSYTIPPSCLLVEGYGKLRISGYSVTIPSGYTLKTEGNHLDAFVTYFHPSSKYSGPGTDGTIGRDTIMEFYPPKKEK